VEPSEAGRARDPARLRAGRPPTIAVIDPNSTATRRLAAREIGSQLDAHIDRSARMATHLQATAPASVTRIPTDDRAVVDIARDVIATTGWIVCA
jgi:hypothetical protein